MKYFSAKTRVIFGQVCLTASILMMALYLGLVPDQDSEIRKNRARLCESIAVNCSILAARNDHPAIDVMLKAITKRSPQLRSAAVRRADGEILCQVGDHVLNWVPPKDGRSTETNIQVPILARKANWGSVELLFEPITVQGWTGMWQHPWTQLIAFVSCTCFIFFSVYLGRVMEQLNPSKVIPKRVRSALDRLAEGLLIADEKGRIVFANETLSGWWGRDPNELAGISAAKFGWCDVNGDPVGRLPWDVAIQEGKLQEGTMLKLIGYDGVERMLVIYASPVMGTDGKYRGVFASFQDVTELEEQKHELTLAKEEVEEANRAKSEFLARMSHEIRTPMNAILGYTDVLRRGFDQSESEREEYLNTIHSSGKHLLSLINDILDLSKIEAGRLELELTRVSPVQIIRQVEQVLRVKADEKSIYLKTEFVGGLPETILTDAVRLRQAIINLVGNAIKFTDQGGVRIQVQLQPSATIADEDKLMIRVIDSGIGISAEGQAKIFDPFSQADTSITRRFGGTGLGLPISRQLIEAMGGVIDLQSELGMGSTFAVTINTGPLEGVEIVDCHEIEAVSESGSSTSTGGFQLPEARVLVVDDGDSNRKLMDLVLARAGVTVETAEHGREACELATASEFDVILMDMQMPIMDGYAATRYLRNAGYTRPIIALTAHAMQGDEEKCRKAGCSGFLTKPIDMDKLIKTLAVELGADPDEVATTDPNCAANTPEKAREESSRPTLKTSLPTHLPDKIVSALPLDDSVFRQVVESFIADLHDHLAALQQAVDAGDTSRIKQISHWLKGAGGTVGFGVFTEPAAQLHDLAVRNQREGMAETMGLITELSKRLYVTETQLVEAK